MPVGLIIAALLLPPLAVFLDQGVSRNFWIDFALTCLGFVPGVIFALYVLIAKRRPTSAPVTEASAT
ncbi:YqaE/Pmp3 family membrane protein [Sphingomonas sp.]|uniref:YqaE/Pmp3 family membrane protein n=1 Tax=Sphingomonas sp. TaxID=28214 RepID=UPI002FC8D427